MAQRICGFMRLPFLLAPEAKESRPGPLGPGDHLGDFREAAVSIALILVAEVENRDLMQFAVVLTHIARTGLRAYRVSVRRLDPPLLSAKLA